MIVAIVISPPPPKPVKPRIRFNDTISGARPQPKQPSRKAIVAVKKQSLRPRMSLKRPYRGWNAVEVMRYEVVTHEIVFSALNWDPITAYVDAVIVPSNP
jgi:hypothetical protein